MGNARTIGRLRVCEVMAQLSLAAGKGMKLTTPDVGIHHVALVVPLAENSAQLHLPGKLGTQL